MKKIFLVLLLLTTTGMFAQDPMLQKDNEEMEARAELLTQQYNEELALTPKQQLLFQKKVEEFLIRAESIRMKTEGKNEMDALAELQIQEITEMNNVLTQPQMDLYKKLRPVMQPIGEVSENEKM
ncbi:MAG: hypothetical protein CMC35_02475 [Flavobacteriaceae bacterium]|nr:hypothetical protein [Flavobacteriaceae bacterium]|tara:strand:+ start:23113 stop:23487 length:375 start_codon:yes stop_codon:yes gene_type:complete